jgi:hypothetical protein
MRRRGVDVEEINLVVHLRVSNAIKLHSDTAKGAFSTRSKIIGLWSELPSLGFALWAGAAGIQ